MLDREEATQIIAETIINNLDSEKTHRGRIVTTSMEGSSMPVPPRRNPPVFHPGVYLDEWMENTGTTADQLSQSTGWTVGQVCEMVSGRSEITKDSARVLDEVTGYSEEFWLTQQRGFNERRKTTVPGML